MVQIKISSLTFIHFQVLRAPAVNAVHTVSQFVQKTGQNKIKERRLCSDNIRQKEDRAISVGELGRWDYLYQELKLNQQC